MISKRARALRYVARCKKPGTPLKAFMTEAGGVNACNTRYASSGLMAVVALAGVVAAVVEV
jgi:hypothetical protein